MLGPPLLFRLGPCSTRSLNRVFVQPRRSYIRGAQSRSTITSNEPKQKEDIMALKNDELRRFPIVHVLRDATKGLPPPQSIEAVLRSLDRTKHVLSLVVPPGRPNTAGPILKIRAVEQRQSSAHTSKASTKVNQPEAAKPKKQETSTLRFTWGISDNDFNHKTLKGQSLLSKGHIVVVTVSKQKGRQARQPSAAEIQEWTTRVNKAMGLETSWVVMHKEPHWLLSKYILSYRGDLKKLEQARQKESSVQTHSGDSIS